MRVECIPAIAQAIGVFLHEQGRDLLVYQETLIQWDRPAPAVFEVAGGLVIAGGVRTGGVPRLAVSVNLIKPPDGAWSVLVSAADPVIPRVPRLDL